MSGRPADNYHIIQVTTCLILTIILNKMDTAFSLMTKPGGSTCNLDCTYCYYLEKQKMYTGHSDFVMQEEMLETFIKKYIAEHPGPEVSFVWQGGEPTLLGIDYYKKALQLQRTYKDGKIITNALQTNGTLLNDEWCRFFKDNNFLIGISIDGPEYLHDQYRVNKGGKGTFKMVMKGLELLKKHRVEFNTLTVINNLNVEKPLEVYRFLKQIGSRYMQFIPIVERMAGNCAPTELSLVTPAYEGDAHLTPWSVPAIKYGNFLISVFNEWVKKDVGRYFVQIFDAALANEVDVPAGVCMFNDVCGYALVIEHNGDVFSCDHFVYPEYKLGNINDNHSSLQTMLQLPAHRKFGYDKYNTLPLQCKTCDVYRYCRGECPKNRHLSTNKGEHGLNYLCEGYKAFFRYIRPSLKYMANELAHRRPAANIMYSNPPLP